MLEKKYNHKQVEEGKYKKWLEGKYFQSGDKSKKPYCIVLLFKCSLTHNIII